MIIKDKHEWVLAVDIGMFSINSYPDTLKNVFNIAFEDEERGDIPVNVYIRCSDQIVQLHQKGEDQITPKGLEEFLDATQKKYAEDMSGIIGDEIKMGNARKQEDLKILMADKIKQLEQKTPEKKDDTEDLLVSTHKTS